MAALLGIIAGVEVDVEFDGLLGREKVAVLHPKTIDVRDSAGRRKNVVSSGGL